MTALADAARAQAILGAYEELRATSMVTAAGTAHSLQAALLRDMQQALAAHDAEQANRGEAPTLEQVLRNDQPRPLRSILTVLCDAADHLLHGHDCDAQGHEEIRYTAIAARELLSMLGGPVTWTGPGLGASSTIEQGKRADKLTRIEAVNRRCWDPVEDLGTHEAMELIRAILEEP
jgi:hypothetical protein